MQGNLIDQGVELMLFGMGTVVLFLALLVVATLLMSWSIGRFFPEPEAVEVASRSKHSVTAPSGSGDPNLVAVISAAIAQHRKNKQ